METVGTVGKPRTEDDLQFIARERVMNKSRPKRGNTARVSGFIELFNEEGVRLSTRRYLSFSHRKRIIAGWNWGYNKDRYINFYYVITPDVED
jgi:hypothetical protein